MDDPGVLQQARSLKAEILSKDQGLAADLSLGLDSVHIRFTIYYRFHFNERHFKYFRRLMQ